MDPFYNLLLCHTKIFLLLNVVVFHFHFVHPWYMCVLPRVLNIFKGWDSSSSVNSSDSVVINDLFNKTVSIAKVVTNDHMILNDG